MIDYKKFIDAVNTKDTLRGHITIKDENGNVLEDKDNLIVLRSRLFVLLHLFKPDAETREDMESTYIKNDNRRICLYKIGMGGADIQSAPFQPFVPKFTDRDLSNPIPFVVTNSIKELDPELNANPSIFLPDKHNFDKTKREMYHCAEENADDSISYFAKTFDNVTFNFNTESNEMYAELQLTIENWDARGFFFNELGLLMAEEYYVEIDSNLEPVLDKNGKPKTITEAEYKAGKFIRKEVTKKEVEVLAGDVCSLEGVDIGLMIGGKEVYDSEIHSVHTSEPKKVKVIVDVEGDVEYTIDPEKYMKQYKDIELFSRVTFGTKSLKTLNNKLIMEYRIYV